MITSTHVVAGQVVDARELVFEVVDPQRLHIEAVAFDPAVAAGIGRATLAVGNERVPLAFVGAARSLREQALPLTSRAQGKVLAALAVGQPVHVFAQGKELVKGIAVPVASLMKNPANQTIVWVKPAPERFEPRTVTVEPLEGVSVAVTSGLKVGDRVATRGAHSPGTADPSAQADSRSVQTKYWLDPKGNCRVIKTPAADMPQRATAEARN